MTVPATYQALASAIDYTLLDPHWTNGQVVEALEIAKRRAVATVTVRPCDIDLAVRALQGSPVRPASIVSYPYGFQNTSVKLYEARDLLRRGASEIGVAMDVSKLLSREFQHVQTELNQVSEACRGAGARSMVRLDTAGLTDELKIIACACCERAEIDGVSGAIQDLPLLRKHLPEETAIQAAGVTGLEQALDALSSGFSRIATASAAAILDEWKQRLAASQPTNPD